MQPKILTIKDMTRVILDKTPVRSTALGKEGTQKTSLLPHGTFQTAPPTPSGETFISGLNRSA